MLYVCVRGVMDVVFSVCIVRRGAVCRCSCIGRVRVSSCRCCMFVPCVYLVAVRNAAFCMTCSLLILVKDGRGILQSASFLSGCNVKFFVQAKTLCGYGCVYFFAALLLVCVDVMVVLSV